jgi:transmembrane 9 superfamily member 3
VWVNSVGPFNNPSQVFKYDSLPLCRPPSLNGAPPARRWGGLGEALGGNALVDAAIPIAYRVPVPDATPLCSQTLTSADVAVLTKAVKRHYWWEWFVDDLPVNGFVGPVPDDDDSDDPVSVFTHRAFSIAINGDRVISVNVSNERPVPVTPGASLRLTYSVDWHETDVEFGARFNLYLDRDADFLEHQIHWFSVVNSALMVVFLTGVVAAIMIRVLKSDFSRYASALDGGGGGKGDIDFEARNTDGDDESGWKLIHGDVFRPPPRLGLLCAAVGTGCQLWLLACVTLALAAAGDMFAERGSITTTYVVTYALTSAVGGYISGGRYSRAGGRAWVRCALATALLFPLVTLSIAAALNTIALSYRSLAAASWGSVAGLLALWLLLSVPLSLAGTLAGRNLAGTRDDPCRVKRIPSPIPPAPWWRSPAAIVAAAGLLPFGSIFIETFFVFASFWSYRFYYVYGFAALVLLILAAVTACVAVVATYVLLASENYNWQWTSFLGGAATGGYVFAYGVHYFFARTSMTGFFQTAFFFGHTLIFALTIATATGGLAHVAAAAFVRRIYRSLKVD